MNMVTHRSKWQNLFTFFVFFLFCFYRVGRNLILLSILIAYCFTIVEIPPPLPLQVTEGERDQKWWKIYCKGDRERNGRRFCSTTAKEYNHCLCLSLLLWTPAIYFLVLVSQECRWKTTWGQISPMSPQTAIKIRSPIFSTVYSKLKKRFCLEEGIS